MALSRSQSISLTPAQSEKETMHGFHKASGVSPFGINHLAPLNPGKCCLAERETFFVVGVLRPETIAIADWYFQLKPASLSNLTQAPGLFFSTAD